MEKISLTNILQIILTTTLILATLFSFGTVSLSNVVNKAGASASACPCPLCCLLLIKFMSTSIDVVAPGMKGEGSKGSEITCWGNKFEINTKEHRKAKLSKKRGKWIHKAQKTS